MTATRVNGIAVIASEPAESPISRPGKTIYFKQIVKLLLENDTEAYGCIHCDWTANESARVRSHLKKHSAKQHTDVTRQTEDEHWRERALRAERELAQIRGVPVVPEPTRIGSRVVMFETLEQCSFFYFIKRSIVSEMRRGMSYPTGIVLQKGLAHQFGLLKAADYFGIPLAIELDSPWHSVRFLFQDKRRDVPIPDSWTWRGTRGGAQ